MQNTKFYIHIGLPKCGSTSLQSFLFNNRSSHLKYGLLYPDTGRTISGYNNHLDLLMQPDKLDHHIDLIDAEVKVNNARKVVISCEEFLSLVVRKPEMIGNFFSKLNKKFGSENIEIIIFIRNIFKFVESVFAQHMKGGIYGIGFEFLKTAQDNFIDAYLEQFFLKHGFELFDLGEHFSLLNNYAKNNHITLSSIENSDHISGDFLKTFADKFLIQYEIPKKTNKRFQDVTTMALIECIKRYGNKRVVRQRGRINDIAKRFSNNQKYSSLHISEFAEEKIISFEEKNIYTLQKMGCQTNEILKKPEKIDFLKLDLNDINKNGWNSIHSIFSE